MIFAARIPASPPAIFPASRAPVAGASTPSTNPRCAATMEVPHTRNAAFSTTPLSLTHLFHIRDHRKSADDSHQKARRAGFIQAGAGSDPL